MPIPYTRLHGIGALPRIVQQEVGEARFLAILEQSDFLEDSLRVRGKVVPQRAVLKLFNFADRVLADRRQKLAIVSAMDPTDYGPWAKFALAGADVRELISRAIKTIYLHQNCGRLSLQHTGNSVRWSYWLEGIAPVPLHIEHAIIPMIEAIRSYTGKNWKPQRIELQYRDERRRQMLEDYLQVPVWMNQSVNSLVFPVQDLACRRNAVAASVQSLLPALFESLHHNIASATRDAVMSALEYNIANHRFDIDSLAKTLGMSTRSLQRELNADGLSYRSMLEQTRMQQALSLMAHGSNNLTQIAVQLGYSDLPHFTRAFKRRFDMPPSAYVELVRDSLEITCK